ncbi:GNAT family N-acetyltransferase [Prevotella sp. 10(H)]|uniref:GNAT family N-acetyltransferase n=1 Tax=Prevotella sp. 10(H) TaxID=1158294 RepID=UPI0004A77751|nr:GNAT family N-acetyltransferase [Prevotella sp. 10(H)]
MEEVLIRKIEDKESGILEDMLYEAIFQPEGAEKLPRDIIRQPDIYVYIDNFGKQKDDYCLVAETGGKIAGAVWIRILAGEVKGFGNIDNSTPEFAISLFKEYRGQGYGTLLMQKMIEYMKAHGYKETSLSVDKNNYAVKMYRKLGFEIIEEREHDYLMVLNLR